MSKHIDGVDIYNGGNGQTQEMLTKNFIMKDLIPNKLQKDNGKRKKNPTKTLIKSTSE